jgi:Spy/CpxP family protein refolding chaperone
LAGQYVGRRKNKRRHLRISERKKVKSKLLIVALLTVAVTTANAKPNRGHGPPQGRNPVDHLTRELSLNEDQAASISSIFESAHAQHEQERETAKQSFCTIRANSEAQIMEVLDEEQRQRFAELKTNRAKRGPGNGEHQKGQRGNRQGRGPGVMDARRQGPPDCDN